MIGTTTTKTPLSGWKKIISTGLAFIGAVIGTIFDVDIENIIFMITPLLYTILEYVRDINRDSKTAKK